jgi:hypothetical protein
MGDVRAAYYFMKYGKSRAHESYGLLMSVDL